MKKISLKTFRKSFNLNKSKEETDFMVVQPPSLAGDFAKEEPLFGGCYGKDVASCDVGGEEERGAKGRAKSESLMGTLKRRLSAKQKPKAKGGAAPGGPADEDAFSSASAPVVFKDARAPRPIRSTSLRSHHYSPTPWPLRPTASEETCIKMEVRVKALVHAAGPGAALNGVRRDLGELQPEPGGPAQSPGGRRAEPQNGDLRLHLEDHVPVVIGLVPQDYLQYTVPLDEGLFPLDGPRPYCLDGSSPMEVSAAPARGGGGAFSEDEGPAEQDLVVAPEIFVDPSVDGLLIGSTGVMLQSPRAGRDDAPPLSPLLPPLQTNPIQRNFGALGGPDAHVAESVRCHLNFDPNSAPGVARVYDSVQSSGPMVVTSLTEELKKLAKQGWYWGPITRWEAEGKLASVPDGSFLVRDSSDDRYLLSLSFRSHGKTLHTRIEHSNGRFSFYEQPDVEGHTSIVDLIEHSIRDSENGAFCYSRSRLPGSATYPVRLTNPVSRFMQVRSLQYLCRFVIRQYTRIDLIQKLPLPNKMKDYLQEKHY
ncbi:suppressor of cytokine signaling 6 [Talpa occidentalis]|uniref:suppressor of cytokine signaling 6 n=1 Tax=Talpa occidentalis TaxID=50954 RepID=UPI00188E38C0|nr:suppressor of cytokine signaling 6 [Talpa occidentalis]XP_037364311.1 suppressor of cytokine signaling 6 [Talpa occidentalis]XP_054549966.1 suppressor of cytokine signaling 6 [Talpa occidentalis]XP_054549967.1 suppressor of cytokine signaling 6 [Talpa occidentalis]XP_054549968.1 suppressor of cytokine signaling 6 [Talpa occidentalis]